MSMTESTTYLQNKKKGYVLVRWEPAEIEAAPQCKGGVCGGVCVCVCGPFTLLPSDSKYLYHFVFPLMKRPYYLEIQLCWEKEVRSFPCGGG